MDVNLVERMVGWTVLLLAAVLVMMMVEVMVEMLVAKKAAKSAECLVAMLALR